MPLSQRRGGSGRRCRANFQAGSEPVADVARGAGTAYALVVHAASPPCPRSLALPHVRRELLHALRELAADDPRPVWREERDRGLVSGIDEVFHFFFDDHDFDERSIGAVVFDRAEVAAVEAVKGAFEAVLQAVGDAGDDAFVEHPLWPEVTKAAASAMSLLSIAQ